MEKLQSTMSIEESCDKILHLLEGQSYSKSYSIATGSYRAELDPNKDILVVLGIPEAVGLSAIKVLYNLKLIYYDMGSRRIVEGKEEYNKIIRLTDEGEDFVKFNSFVEMKQKQDLEERMKQAEYKNNVSSARLNEWLIKTKWLPHIVAIISLIVAIVALIKSYQ